MRLLGLVAWFGSLTSLFAGQALADTRALPQNPGAARINGYVSAGSNLSAVESFPTRTQPMRRDALQAPLQNPADFFLNVNHDESR
jgi:hypothetical protein